MTVPLCRQRLFTGAAWSAARRDGAGRAPYGIRLEERLKRGLADEFRVIASADLDFLQKLDCVVRDNAHPELPAVGIQITARAHDREKMMAVLATLRRTRAVSRAMYLVIEAELRDGIFPALALLIREIARMDREAMAVVCLRQGAKGLMLETAGLFDLATGGRVETIH